MLKIGLTKKYINFEDISRNPFWDISVFVSFFQLYFTVFQPYYNDFNFISRILVRLRLRVSNKITPQIVNIFTYFTYLNQFISHITHFDLFRYAHIRQILAWKIGFIFIKKDFISFEDSKFVAEWAFALFWRHCFIQSVIILKFPIFSLAKILIDFSNGV